VLADPLRVLRMGGRPSHLIFLELRYGEVRAEGRAGKAGNWSERGNRTGGYSSSTNSSMGTPYALAIFVTVGM
jgi:hypothetical protein